LGIHNLTARNILGRHFQRRGKERWKKIPLGHKMCTYTVLNQPIEKQQVELQASVKGLTNTQLETRLILSHTSSSKIDFLRCSFNEINLSDSPSASFKVIHVFQDQKLA
jgi:hypothetical protein